MCAMRDSGLEWLGEIPAEWSIVKGKHVFALLQRPVRDSDGVITCFRDGEVTLRSNRRTEGFTVALKEIGYQGIEPGDLVVHGMDGFAGSIGISDSRGKASPVLNVLDSTQNKKFLMYYLRALAYREVYLALADGIRVRSCNLSWKKIGSLPIALPSPGEQLRIVSYLDEKCAQVDRAIEAAEGSIEEYKAYKESIVSHAVTRGLEKHAEMKDSGVEWLGWIPAHWSKTPIKRMFYISKTIAGKTGFDVLSITQRGLKVKDITSGEGQLAADYSNYQIVEPGDFAMNHMDLLTGWIDVSDRSGVTSPDYRVFKAHREDIDKRYYLRVFQYYYFGRIFYGFCKGISSKGRWRLPADAFRNMQVPVPPLDEQRRIADYLDERCAEIDRAIAAKRAIIADLKTYKQSLVFEVVTGKREV